MRTMLATALLIGCATTAEMRERTATGGVLGMKDEDGMPDAKRKMAEHCGQQGYHIVREERVPAGRETLVVPVGQSYAAVPGKEKTEYRITYVCG